MASGFIQDSKLRIREPSRVSEGDEQELTKPSTPYSLTAVFTHKKDHALTLLPWLPESVSDTRWLGNNPGIVGVGRLLRLIQVQRWNRGEQMTQIIRSNAEQPIQINTSK